MLVNNLIICGIGFGLGVAFCINAAVILTDKKDEPPTKDEWKVM